MFGEHFFVVLILLTFGGKSEALHPDNHPARDPLYPAWNCEIDL